MRTDRAPAGAKVAGISYRRRRGDGATLVLLHGIGSNAESWAPLIAALDPAVDAIAWDAPGYGGSDPLSDATPTPAEYAVRLAAFLDALKLDRVRLAGHSLGCLFAVRFAVSYPARVSALALLSPALGYGVGAGEKLPPTVQGRIDDLEGLGAAAFAAKRAPRLLHHPEAKPHVLDAVRRAMAAVNPSGYAQAVHALGSGTLLADAARVAAPTLVAVGAQDVVTPPANARSVYDALSHRLGLHIVPDAGHALPQEAPSLVAQLITEETSV
jgi:pimeloyl-ACP methyl ester carboxylesterase